MNELRVGEILRDTMDTYKAKWKTILMLSLISMVISTVLGMFGMLIGSFMQLRVQLMLLLINLVVTLISLYFTSRLSVSMIIVSNSDTYDEDVNVSTSYEKAKDTTWRYIGKALLYGLMLIIPVFLVMLGLFYGRPMGISVPTRWGLFLVGIFPMLYLSTTYFFSTYAAVLHPREESVFSYSKQLVKGNFFKVFLITLIPLFISFPLYISGYFLKIDTLSVGMQFLVSTLISLPGIFIAPFTVLLSVMAMRKLESLKAEVEVEVEVI